MSILIGLVFFRNERITIPEVKTKRVVALEETQGLYTYYRNDPIWSMVKETVCWNFLGLSSISYYTYPPIFIFHFLQR